MGANSKPVVVLTIAGYDPSSGAGITADLATFAAHGLFGISCITALTVQSTQGVAQVHPVAPDLIRATLTLLAADFRIAGIKVGMLGSVEAATEVAQFLASMGEIPVVLDPILQPSRGKQLADPQTAELMVQKLFPLATVITPNMEEAGVLTGTQVADEAGMEVSARKLRQMGVRNVIVTGGHSPQNWDQNWDLLLLENGAPVVIEGQRVEA